MPQQIPGVWGLAPNHTASHPKTLKGIQKCFLNQLLTKIKTVADPFDLTSTTFSNRF
jgi:hypothetical protein